MNDRIKEFEEIAKAGVEVISILTNSDLTPSDIVGAGMISAGIVVLKECGTTSEQIRNLIGNLINYSEAADKLEIN